MSEGLTVFSDEWVLRLKQEVRSNSSYREAARGWEGDMDLRSQGAGGSHLPGADRFPHEE